MARRGGRGYDDWDEADARGEARPDPALFAGLGQDGGRLVRRLVDPALAARAAEQLGRRARQLADDIATLERQETARQDGARPQYGKRIGDHTSDALETRRAVAALDTLRQQADAVERACAKLAAGTYGWCDVCGEAISPDRLAALPWATACVECRVAKRPGGG